MNPSLLSHPSSLLKSAFAAALLQVSVPGVPVRGEDARGIDAANMVWTNEDHRKIGEGSLWAFNKGTGFVCLRINHGRSVRHSLHLLSDLSDEHRKIVEVADAAALPGKEGYPREPRFFDTGLQPGMSLRQVLAALEAHGFQKPSISMRPSTSAVIARHHASSEGGFLTNHQRQTCTSRATASKIESVGRSDEASIQVEAHFIEDVTQTPPVPVAYKLEYRIRFKHLPREQGSRIVKSKVEAAFGPPLNERTDFSWKYTDQPRPDSISDEQLAGSSSPFVKPSSAPPARMIKASDGGAEWSDHVLLMRIAEARAKMIRKGMDAGSDVQPSVVPSKNTVKANQPALSAIIAPLPIETAAVKETGYERSWQTREGLINGRLWAWNPQSNLVVIRPSDTAKDPVRLMRGDLSAEEAACLDHIQPSELPAGTGAPKAFDILGIKPGMTAAEVTNILRELRFETRSSTSDDARTCVASRIAWHAKQKLTQRRRLPHAIEGTRIENRGERNECTVKVTVRLMEDGTLTPSDSRVYSARLHKSLSSRALKEDLPAARDEFLAHVRAKFGEPVCGDADTWIYSDTYHGLSNPPSFSETRPTSGSTKLEPVRFGRRVEAESSGHNSYVEFVDARQLFELQSSIINLFESLQPAAVEPVKSNL